jgi:Phycobilisome protein
MITLLENVLERADGTYVSAQDLQLLDRALSSWKSRKDAYNAVQENEDEIIQAAVIAMRSGDRFDLKPMDDLGVDRCQRDMAMGLRCCALAMLLQDEEMLKDRVLYWQQNVFQAMKLNYEGYRFLRNAVKSQLSGEHAALLGPYLLMAHEMMSVR